MFFVYLPFFLPPEYLCTPSVEENGIHLPFSTATPCQKKFFDKVNAVSYETAFFAKNVMRNRHIQEKYDYVS